MNEKLKMMMEPKPGETGRWILLSEQKPPKYGEYEVIRRTRSRELNYDLYLWNGGYFVTKGHSPSTAVEAWYKEGNLDG